jgi:hypothetical protein
VSFIGYPSTIWEDHGKIAVVIWWPMVAALTAGIADKTTIYNGVLVVMSTYGRVFHHLWQFWVLQVVGSNPAAPTILARHSPSDMSQHSGIAFG